MDLASDFDDVNRVVVTELCHILIFHLGVLPGLGESAIIERISVVYESQLSVLEIMRTWQTR